MRPNLFIVGAAKAGTTFLYGALSGHSQIAMSRPKEPGYFADPEFPSSVAETEEEYRNLFPAIPDARFAGEASVSYLYSRGSAGRIRGFNPSARIVITVRNPADVVISLHHTVVFYGHQSEPDLARALRAAATRPNQLDYPWLRYYNAVRFSQQVSRYLDTFPPHQIRIVNFDDLVQNPERVTGDLLRWLGLAGSLDLEHVPRNDRVDPRSRRLARWLRRPPASVSAIGRALPPSSRRALARWVKRRNAAYPATKVDERVRQRLLIELEPEVQLLETLLDRDLTAWLPQR